MVSICDEDIIAVSSDIDISHDKPIIQLFECLINNVNKQNILFKNSQISELLQKEFNVDVRNLHVLEIRLYITLVKKFLKDWPDWNSFDRDVNKLKKKGKLSINSALLKENYSSLKSFLKSALDAAKPLVQAAVEKIKEKEKYAKQEKAKEDDPVLEINATKAQLKQLFLRRPNPKSRSIFNVARNIPRQIKTTNMTLRSILNMPGITITIMSSEDTILYKHETNHEFKYNLCNKRLVTQPNRDFVLNQEIKYRGSSNVVINVSHIINFIKNSYNAYVLSDIMEIINFITISLKLLPSKVFHDSTYRRQTNKYPYVRYFYKEVENALFKDIKKFDIQLQEIIIPVHEIYLGNFTSVLNSETNLSENSIVVTCTECSANFQGKKMVDELKIHFNMQHNSPDVQCNNCLENFTVETIASNWWCHKCKST